MYSGGVFLVLLIIQHVGGVLTLLRGQTFNSSHRKLAVIVGNFGRILCFFGFVIAKAESWILLTTGILTIVFLIGSVKKVFIDGAKSEHVANKKSKNTDSNGSASPSRAKSPKRD